MAQQELDALIIYGESEVTGPSAYTLDNWITNQRPQSTVVFPRKGNPLWLTAQPKGVIGIWHEEQAGEQPWVGPQDVRIGRDAETLIRTLRELKVECGRIGVCGLEPIIPIYPSGMIPYSLWHRVVSDMPKATFKAVGQAFSIAIMPLSDEQISVLRHAAKIGDCMAHAMVKASGPGIPENEIFSAGMNAGYMRGANVPLLHMFTGPQAVQWGPPRWTYSAQSRPRVLDDGDLVTSEIFCDYGKMQVQLQMTIAIGRTHPDVERAATIVRQCYEEGLKVLTAGRTFRELAEAMRKPLDDNNAWSKGPQVHSLNPLIPVADIDIDLAHVGVPANYPRVWKAPVLVPDLILEPGMSFAMEPTCAIGPYAVTIGGTVVVTEGEPMELNTYTTRLLRAS
jgi:Xaa-Pro aminopeptidase